MEKAKPRGTSWCRFTWNYIHLVAFFQDSLGKLAPER